MIMVVLFSLCIQEREKREVVHTRRCRKHFHTCVLLHLQSYSVSQFAELAFSELWIWIFVFKQKHFESDEKETEVTVITTRRYRSTSASVTNLLLAIQYSHGAVLQSYCSPATMWAVHAVRQLLVSCSLVNMREWAREPDWLAEFVGEWERRG